MSSHVPKQESEPADAAGQQGTDAAAEPDERREIIIRRAPKYVPFLLLGAFLAFSAAVLIAYSGPNDGDFSRSTVLGFFSMALLLPGLLLGALTALALDRLGVRRSKRAYLRSVKDETAEPRSEGRPAQSTE